MTEKDLEIQNLRRDVDCLVKDNVKLQHDYDALQLVRQLDMGEVVRLRRTVEMLEEEIETKDEMIRVLKEKARILQDAVNLWERSAEDA